MRWACFLLVILLCSSAQAFDHTYQEYAKVLHEYVKDGRVNYAALQKNRTGIDRFVKDLNSVSATEYQSWPKEQQLAFWINAYNGWFLQIVIDRYPIRGRRLIGALYPENSVQRIVGIWDNIKTQAAGRTVSLNDIEHKIIRPIFKEPRIHFAIVCASVGCPALRSEPLLPQGLSEQLDDATRRFVNDPNKVRWNAKSKKLELSPIFDWFADDFKNTGGAVAFVQRYASEHLAAVLKSQTVRVQYLDYDWSLNDVQ